MERPNSSGLDRRGSRRRAPKRGVRATCRRGALDLGPNLAVAVLNVSETGIALLLTEALDSGQQISLTLDATTGGRPVKRLGTVVWSAPAAEGTSRAGVRFEKPLRGIELDHLSRP
jgi:hypothetical protein